MKISGQIAVLALVFTAVLAFEADESTVSAPATTPIARQVIPDKPGNTGYGAPRRTRVSSAASMDWREPALVDSGAARAHRQAMLSAAEDALLFDENIQVRLDALLHLEAMGGPEAANVIVKGLGDASPLVRAGVIDSIGILGPHATHLLGQVLFAEADVELRRQAVEVLGEQSSPVARALLSTVAASDSDAALARRAGELADAGEWLAEPTVESPAPYQDQDQDHHYDLLGSAGAASSRERVAILQRLLASDPESALKAEAVAMLAEVDSRDATLAIAEMLADQDTAVRAQSIDALAERREYTLHFFAQVLFSDPDPSRRQQAVEWIAAAGGEASRALLVSALDDADAEVVVAAGRGLQRSP